jgi:energy-coupling factor transporter ATP-binding protein EcfA2
MNDKITYLEYIDNSIKNGEVVLSIIKENKLEYSGIEKIIDSLKFLQTIRENVDLDIIPVRYYQHFRENIDSITSFFSSIVKLFAPTNIEHPSLEHIIQNIDGQIIKHNIESMWFNYDFFCNLGFFEKNIVVIGANGSGKTSLTNKLKYVLPDRTSIVISAQKILIIPTFDGISNYNNTSKELTKTYGYDKQNKSTYDAKKSDSIPYNYMYQHGSEFRILLDNLLAERNALRNQFVEKFLAVGEKVGTKDKDLLKTKLDRAFEIWNFLINDRKMDCSDGINITISSVGQKTYPAYMMSDGEKVILFHIAQILQAPQNGFIIIDEPEMYLHKTILCKLWDILEKERPDCLFIYLSHDLEFASTRISAQKAWIKSFVYPGTWKIEHIPENDIPEELLMRILGSKRTILFCEGKKEKSLDPIILEILFPNLSISPVDTCKDVINYTKAFNKMPNTNTKAIGLVDSDFRTEEEIDSLKKNNIYSYNVAEIENLLLDDVFLQQFAVWIRCTTDSVTELKQRIIEQLEQDKELQVSNTLSSRIQHVYTTTHMEKGNTKEEVIQNFQDFSSNINIDVWYKETMDSFNDIISKKDYKSAIQKFNNKGLLTHANKIFNIGNFQQRAIQFLAEDEDAKSILRKNFPEQIQKENSTQDTI